ncbi:MAG: hypothetical protein UHN02_03785 [Acutalibacteraceae bacterium]|nr:hypothetical protein [Acutalibacteraceae bacterium]
MRQKDKKTKIKVTHYSVAVLRTALVLFCITVISAYLIFGVYSKFQSALYGGDYSRVAHFSPSMTSEKIIVADAKPGFDGNISFSVQNFSDDENTEVDLKYKITLSTTGNIPLTFTLLDSEENTLEVWVCDGISGECIYEYTDPSLVFHSGEKKTDKYKLKVQWPSGQNDAKFSAMTDAVYLAVEYEQID